jgi:hypothetical protein
MVTITTIRIQTLVVFEINFLKKKQQLSDFYNKLFFNNVEVKL